MGRKIKGNASDFQERVMMAMYAAQYDTARYEAEYHYLQGRGVAHLLGGAWSTYRHKEMLKLQDSKIVVCYKKQGGRGQWFYALTPLGSGRVEELIAVARRNSFTLSKEQKEKALDAQESLFSLENGNNGHE